jgi:hypothetical protein
MGLARKLDPRRIVKRAENAARVLSMGGGLGPAANAHARVRRGLAQVGLEYRRCARLIALAKELPRPHPEECRCSHCKTWDSMRGVIAKLEASAQ